MATLLVTHPDCVKHEIAPQHPECPERIGAILDQLDADGILEKLTRHTAEEASVEQLRLGHHEAYVQKIIDSAPKEGRFQLDADTAMNPWSLRAARLSAGAAIQATDLVLAGKATNAFCCTRPPGHHAERGHAMGFCLFCNVALAALHALKQPSIKKVAIFDFDVHHGNGTEDIIGDNPNVFFCSTFQSPLYPSKYGKNVPGRKLNVPFDAGTAGTEYRERVAKECLPALREFDPDMLFISAGFDAHRDDPLAGMLLDVADFEWITKELLAVAKEVCGKRVVSMLEGGYNLKALAQSAAAHVQLLMNS